MKRVKHFKLLVFLYFSLVFFFSGIISNFVHESIHVLQVKSQGFEPLDVCYWGYTNELKGACSWVSFFQRTLLWLKRRSIQGFSFLKI